MTVMWEGCVYGRHLERIGNKASLYPLPWTGTGILKSMNTKSMQCSFTVWYNKEKCHGFLCGTNFMSSESSLSSLVGVVLIPLFLARGQPDKLKIESMKLIKPGDKKLQWNSREKERERDSRSL